MKVPSLVFCMCLFATAGSAAEQTVPVLTEGNKNAPFVDTSLYLLTLKCTLPNFDPKARVFSPFGDKNEVLVFALTISNSPVGANQAPPASSVLAAIPVAAETVSQSAPVTFTNDNCGQSFLVTGRTPLYLTILYTDQTSYTPSPGVQFLDALAGTILPLAVFFPTGAANLIKQDAAIPTAMSGPFATLLTTKNYQINYTRTTKPLQQGYYLIQTPNGKAGSVAISIDRLSSIQSALTKQPIRDAFETSLQTFAGQVSTGIGNNPTICFTLGRLLEFNQNLSHADAVHALAQIVVWSTISSVQASNCLGTSYGPEVRDDPWFKQNSNLHLGNFPDIQNAVPFSLRVYTQIVNAMNGYAAAKKTGATPQNTADLDKWFLSQVDVTDTTQTIGPNAKMSIEQLLDKLLAAKPQYVAYGCAEKDATFPDDSGVLDTGYLLAIGQAASPDDLLLLRTWWKYDQGSSNQAHINEVNVGSDAAIQQALKDYGNECAFHVKVNVPPGH
jgi:hypothetical protein